MIISVLCWVIVNAFNNRSLRIDETLFASVSCFIFGVSGVFETAIYMTLLGVIP